jgi:hypothetical protein
VPLQFVKFANQPEAFDEASKERNFLFTPILFDSQHFLKFVNYIYINGTHELHFFLFPGHITFLLTDAISREKGIQIHGLTLGLFLSESFIVAFLLAIDAATVRLAI